jgi:cyclopropane fatty-acyl-phospholipid synthase-like methyltransferase
MGCGSGALVAFLIRQGYQSVIGVDGSAEQVAVAHAAGIDSVRQGDVFDFLHGARESFDAITAVDILEHFRKDEVLDFLVAVRLALRPGGRIIVQTTNGGSPFFGNYRYADFTHELAFTAQSINQVMMVTGYARTTVYPVRPGVHGIRSLVRRGLWGGVETVMVACLVIETGIRKGHVVSQNLIAVGERDAASELGIQTT